MVGAGEVVDGWKGKGALSPTREITPTAKYGSRPACLYFFSSFDSSSSLVSPWILSASALFYSKPLLCAVHVFIVASKNDNTMTLKPFASRGNTASQHPRWSCQPSGRPEPLRMGAQTRFATYQKNHTGISAKTCRLRLSLLKNNPFLCLGGWDRLLRYSIGALRVGRRTKVEGRRMKLLTL